MTLACEASLVNRISQAPFLVTREAYLVTHEWFGRTTKYKERATIHERRDRSQASR